MIALILVSFSLSVKAESPDTLLSVSNPDKVIITESPDGTRVSVGDGRETVLIEYPDGAKVSASRSVSRSIISLPGFSGEGSGRYTTGWCASADGLCIGLTDPLRQSGGGGIQWSKSFEICWLSCLNVGYAFRHSRIYLGLGFDWRNYKATADARWLVPDGSGGVEWGSAPEGASVRASQLKVFSLQIPFMYVWPIPNTYLKWRIGPILNFNTYASIKGIYDDASGNRCEYFTKDFDRNPVTLDLFASLSYSNALGIYVRYSPMKVLKDASPVNLTPFTVGLTFLL